jgi:phage terminase large subunit
VEEAHLVSKTSWEILITTIRKDNSEIWVSFNPELEDDDTYKRFVINPPPNSIVVEINWRDNPWFPEVLRQEKDDLKARDEDAYYTVWEGKCRLVLEGSIFAKQLKAAYSEDRIRQVPYDPTLPVDTYWDLGWADFTSIWFIQPGPLEFRVIRFYQNHLQDIDHYLLYLQSVGYPIREIYLPHDGAAATLASGGRSIRSIVKGKGFSCTVIDRIKDKIMAVNAARAVFPQCYFDQKNCADGLLSLKRYRFEYDEDTGKYGDKPAHDWASHGASAFEQFGIKARLEPVKQRIDIMSARPKYHPFDKLQQLRA